jgi:hypothetical protein
MKVFSGLLIFLGMTDEETRGGALSSVMKIKILLRYVADPGIKK